MLKLREYFKHLRHQGMTNLTFKQWCKKVNELGYKPQPDHESEWLEWYQQGKTPEEARKLEEVLWITT
jgi:hypothetical protein